MSKEERVDVTLGSWSPPEQYDGPDFEAQEDKPWADIRGPIAAAEVGQPGEKAQVFTFEGEAYDTDIAVLQKYRGEILRLRHPVYTGQVYIESVEADPTERQDEVTEFRFHDGEMQDVTEAKAVYSYRVGLVAIDGMTEE